MVPLPPKGRGSHFLTQQPRELVFNALALACGFVGNLILLLNFTSRVRYIVALPLVILFWFLSALMASQQNPLNQVLALTPPNSSSSSSP